jgi:hypothetical protein
MKEEEVLSQDLDHVDLPSKNYEKDYFLFKNTLEKYLEEISGQKAPIDYDPVYHLHGVLESHKRLREKVTDLRQKIENLNTEISFAKKRLEEVAIKELKEEPPVKNATLEELRKNVEKYILDSLSEKYVSVESLRYLTVEQLYSVFYKNGK